VSEAILNDTGMARAIYRAMSIIPELPLVGEGSAGAIHPGRPTDPKNRSTTSENQSLRDQHEY
jgi:hypothetical protein